MLPGGQSAVQAASGNPIPIRVKPSERRPVRKSLSLSSDTLFDSEMKTRIVHDVPSQSVCLCLSAPSCHSRSSYQRNGSDGTVTERMRGRVYETRADANGKAIAERDNKRNPRAVAARGDN